MVEARDVVPAVGGMGEGVELRIRCGRVHFRRRLVRGLVETGRGGLGGRVYQLGR